MNTMDTSNLEVGCATFAERGWGTDLHACFYRDAAEALVGGVSAKWWQEWAMPTLGQWLAIRPLRYDVVRAQGLVHLPDLDAAYVALTRTRDGANLSIEAVAWDDAAGLFAVAQRIKQTKWGSPVFASKLCHFLLPSVYPVADNEVMGGCPSYELFWRGCRDLWVTCDQRHHLIGVLREKIGSDLYDRYPWATKIVELCLIGAQKGAGPESPPT